MLSVAKGDVCRFTLAPERNLALHTQPFAMKRTFLTGLFLASSVAAQDRPFRTTFPDCLEGLLANNTVCDQNASPAERASALVEAMTIEEKLQNLVR